MLKLRLKRMGKKREVSYRVWSLKVLPVVTVVPLLKLDSIILVITKLGSMKKLLQIGSKKAHSPLTPLEAC